MDINLVEKELNSTHKRRFKKIEKKNFYDYVSNLSSNLGYESSIQGSKRTKNIIFGDLENAEILIGAHYDTPFFSRHLTILTRFFGYWIGQFILIPLMVLLYSGLMVLGFKVIDNINFKVEIMNYIIRPVIPLISFIIFMFILMPFMFSNPSNANDNTSGVLGVLSCMKKLSPNLKNKVAFVLFDNEEWGLLGSNNLSRYIKKQRIKNKFVINMDCIGLGEYYYICGLKSNIMEKLTDNLKIEANLNDIKTSNFKYAYPSDHVSFKESLSICVYSKAILTKTVSIKNYHSPNDKVIDLNKIDIISNAIVKTLNS